MAEVRELPFKEGHGPGAGGVAFAKHDGGLCLVTCGADGHVCVRDPATGEAQRSHPAGGPGSKSAVLTLAASAKGGLVATGDKDTFVKVTFFIISDTWACSVCGHCGTLKSAHVHVLRQGPAAGEPRAKMCNCWVHVRA